MLYTEEESMGVYNDTRSSSCVAFSASNAIFRSDISMPSYGSSEELIDERFFGHHALLRDIDFSLLQKAVPPLGIS